MTGRKLFIPMAAGADSFLVSTRTGLVLVDAGAPGVVLETAQTQDGGHFGTLTLVDVACRPVEGDMQEAIEEAAMLTAASLLGVMERSFALTLDYLRTRKQFGRPIGSFQALQHRAADLKLKMTPEDWLGVVGVHLNGSFFVSRAAAEPFRAQGSGAYVHMTSTSGLVGNFGQANYSAAKLGIVALSKSIALDMRRFGVRSNCIAPFAWSRMTSSIPAETPEQQARVAKLQQMTPDKNAPMAVFLASDAAAGVTGQVFATRCNEVVLMSQSRPLRSVHRAEGWTPALIAEHAAPALRPSLLPLDRSHDVFGWDPV